jgi:hypothetical protein
MPGSLLVSRLLKPRETASRTTCLKAERKAREKKERLWRIPDTLAAGERHHCKHLTNDRVKREHDRCVTGLEEPT